MAADFAGRVEGVDYWQRSARGDSVIVGVNELESWNDIDSRRRER